MDQLVEFCARLLGDPGNAAAVAGSARAAGGDDELATLQHALTECRGGVDGEHVRAAVGGGPVPQPPATASGADLSAAVAAELAIATARLPVRQREALALRELLGLSHEELSLVLAIEPAAVAPLLARSRLRLRAELRSASLGRSDCAERDRMLRVATLRQDGEHVAAVDDDWLLDHLGHCEDCIRAHAAMLEGSACYRGWRSGADPATPARATT